MIATDLPIQRTRESLELAKTRRRRALSLGGVLGLAVSALLVMGPSPSLANHQDPACTVNQQQGKLCVTVSDTPDPVAYSGFDGNSAWLLYKAVVTNASRSSSLSHVQLSEALPAATTFVSATSSRGSCTGFAQSVACTIGSLRKGQSATVDVIVTSPATSDPNPPDTTIENAVTVGFDEVFNDQANNGKQDSAIYMEPTVVSKTAGQAYVPIGRSGKVGTDPAQSQYASSSIPNASSDVLAAIDVAPPDAFCASETVRIQNKTYVCRAGGFVEASVTNAVTGETYANPQSPLVFHLRWDGSLVSDKQTVRNFVVFYQSTATAPIQVFDERCNATASNTPCLKNITPLADGGIEADLVKPDNGRMR
jgi:uncharacterized repeat protein (TIGR01451 family)